MAKSYPPYDEKIGLEICRELATSNEGIRKLCKKNKHWPGHDTIFHWRIVEKEFGERYARAKCHQIEVLVDEVLEIADDTSEDVMEDAKGRSVYDKEHINRSRLRIDTRKWLAAKLAPKLYGDKVEQYLTTDSGKVKATIEVQQAREAYKDSFKKEY